MQTKPIPESAKTTDCCSGFYEQDWVRYLAEDIFHPGGEALSCKTVEAMNLSPGARIVELGCGTGTTAQLLAKAFGLQVSAIDRSAANVERAESRFGTTQPAAQFTCADAQLLPFDDGVFDAALAECTFSLFADQRAALREVHRTLKPGGQLAVTDMATGRPLPEDVAGVLAPWTCLADAVDQESYAVLFQANGFQLVEIWDESWGLRELVLQIKRKLLLLGTGSLVAPTALPELDTGTIRFWLERFKGLVEDGTIRYLRFQLVRRD